MATFVLLLIFSIIGLGIWGYEKFKEEAFIAAAIDGNVTNSNFITEDTQNVIDSLKDASKLKLRRYMNCIILPDGQQISYLTDSEENFKKYSTLNFQPTPKEWKILKGIVKKLYSTL